MLLLRIKGTMKTRAVCSKRIATEEILLILCCCDERSKEVRLSCFSCSCISSGSFVIPTLPFTLRMQ